MEVTATPNINILKEQRDAFLAAAAKLDAVIKGLEGNSEKPIDWKNSALDCLRRRKYPLRTVDILNCMFINEPDKLKDTVKRRNYINALSIALNNLCDRDYLGRIMIPGFKGYFYGFKQLFYSPGVLQKFANDELMYQLWENPESVFQIAEKAKKYDPEIYEGKLEENDLEL